jgi:transposase
MLEIITVGLDLAKNVFQVHGADAAGRAVLRKKLRRDQVLAFFGQLPTCVVAMESCGGTHFRAREIGKLDDEIGRCAKENEVTRRLMTVPGIGPLIATAIAVLDPPPETFCKARDFAVWLSLTPRQHSTEGKQRLGATTRMGERSLRRLLLIGANSVIIKRHVHAATRLGTWLGGMLTRKPPMLVRVALANKMARIVWALMARGGVYKAPATAA